MQKVKDEPPEAAVGSYTLRTAAAVGDVTTCKWFVGHAQRYLDEYLDRDDGGDEGGNAEEYVHKDQLDYRSDVNAQDKINARSALHYAAAFGHSDVVALLLKQPQVDVENPDRYGALAIHNARTACVRQLLADGHARSESKDVVGKTLLLRASQEGRVGALECLFELYPDYEGSAYLDRRDQFGMTAVARAAQNGYPAVISMLAQKGANLDLQCGPEEMTALMFAIAYASIETIEMLVALGADIHTRRTRSNRYSPLLLAARHNRVDAINVLGAHGDVDRHATTTSGLDAVSLAVQRGYAGAVDALVGIGCSPWGGVYKKVEDILHFPASLVLSHAITPSNEEIQSSLSFLSSVEPINKDSMNLILRPPPEEKTADLTLEDIDWVHELQTFFLESAELPARAKLSYVEKVLSQNEGNEMDYFRKLHAEYQVDFPEKFHALDSTLKGIDIIARPMTKRQRRRKREAMLKLSERVGDRAEEKMALSMTMFAIPDDTTNGNADLLSSDSEDDEGEGKKKRKKKKKKKKKSNKQSNSKSPARGRRRRKGRFSSYSPKSRRGRSSKSRSKSRRRGRGRRRGMERSVRLHEDEDPAALGAMKSLLSENWDDDENAGGSGWNERKK